VRNYLALFVGFFLSTSVLADTGTLSVAKQLQPLEATHFDWEFNLGTEVNQIRGKHRWRASDDNIIHLPGADHRGWIKWTLRNYQRDSEPDYTNDDCTASGVPDACCTGVGEGTCDDLVNVQNGDCTADGLVGTQSASCCTAEDVGVCRAWSDTVMFNCGTSACDNMVVGPGLRTLIKNQWKRKYCVGCTITF